MNIQTTIIFALIAIFFTVSILLFTPVDSQKYMSMIETNPRLQNAFNDLNADNFKFAHILLIKYCNSDLSCGIDE